MRIVVNDIAASYGGAMTVLRGFYSYVRAHAPQDGDEWIFLLGDEYLEPTDNIRIISLPQIKKSGVKKVIFDLFTGRRVINKLEPDAVLSLQNIITFGVKAEQTAYIHQSLPFQEIQKFSFFRKSERSTAFYQYIVGAFIKASAKRADAVVVQSEWMRDAVASKARIPREKISVVRPSVAPISPDPEKFIKNRFFYPTNSEPYKNIELIVKACDILAARGVTDFSVALTLPQQSPPQTPPQSQSEAASHPCISCIGRLDFTAMADAYRESTLLFPSYIETVGLPLIEARSCGAPILAADTAFAREALNGYKNAFYYDRLDAKALAGLMEKVMNGAIRPLPLPDSDKTAAVADRDTGGWEAVYRMIRGANTESRRE